MWDVVDNVTDPSTEQLVLRTSSIVYAQKVASQDNERRFIRAAPWGVGSDPLREPRSYDPEALDQYAEERAERDFWRRSE